MGSTKRRPRNPTLRALRIIGGVLLTLVGLALLVLPGPGIPVLLGGLFLLGEEFGPVRKLTEKLKRGWRRARRGKVDRERLPSPPVNPPGAEPFGGTTPQRPVLS